MHKMNSSELKDFLIRQVLLMPDRDSNPDTSRLLAHISKTRLDKPLIYVGMTSCSYAAGARKTFDTISEYLADYEIDADLVKGGCKGYCKAEPLVDIQLPGKARIVFRNMTSEKVYPLLDEVLNYNIPGDNILGQYRNDIHQQWSSVPYIDEIPFFSHQKRILLSNCGIINPVSIAEYISRGGYQAFADTITHHTPAQVCNLIEDSMLAGRGGGGFLAGKKWKFALSTASEQKYFVCNAVESDPGSYMNRTIMESDPHMLIEALLIASYAIGASKAFIFTRSEFTLSNQRLRAAMMEAEDYGLIGHNILDSGVNIDLALKEGARAFVCGEETALINSIEGKRAMPTSKPPFPAVKGLWNSPTVLNNVETLINVPSILKNGIDWYQNIGTPKSKGTKLFSLTGQINEFGTIEVEMGVSFSDIVNKIGGGMSNGHEFRAIILGINSGSFITEKTLDTLVDFDALKNVGSALGSGACVVVDKTTCMIDIAMFFTEFFKNQSCGKCIPCREGTARLLTIIKGATQKPSRENNFQTLERFKGILQLNGLAAVMKDTSLCSLGKSAPNAILNVLDNFKPEFDAHVFERKCPAGVCRDLRTYTIDVDKCTGCTGCYKKCPVGAIIGSARQPHFIIHNKCISCNACFEACKFNAVIIE